jgi:DNA-binding CsgD family transcriptional regulator
LRHLAAGEREDADSLLDGARSVLEGCPDPGAILLSRLADAERRLRPAAPPPAPPTVGEALSDRELSVLRLLATKLSQREIGGELYVSLNTVKTHTRHIFRKARRQRSPGHGLQGTRGEPALRIAQRGLSGPRRSCAPPPHPVDRDAPRRRPPSRRAGGAWPVRAGGGLQSWGSGTTMRSAGGLVVV